MSVDKPDIKCYSQGHVKCSLCSAEVPISSDFSLQIIKCPICDSPVFIPLKISKYWLYEPLGGGGMGCVFKAISEDSEKEFALKILPRDKKNNPEFIKNLQRETDVMRAFGKHSHLIELIDNGQDKDEHFMATELIYGDRLDVLVESKKQLPEKEAFDIILQLIDAEKHICKSGYLYRDLKPQNIIIQSDGGVKLIDYGLCMLLEQAAPSEQVSDELEGSPFYLPPERIVGASEGEYSEIYSLGMLLFYMLTGRTYYSKAEIEDIIAKHVTSLRMMSVGTHLQHCNGRGVSVLDKMIARNPNMRYPNLDSLEKDIKDVLAEISAKPTYPALVKESSHGESIIERLKKKKKTILISLSSIFLLFVIIIISNSVYESFKLAKIKKEIIGKTASSLGIRPDIKVPDLPLDQVKKLVAQKSEQIFTGKIKSLQDFDRNDVVDSICKKLNIQKSMTKKSHFTIAELNKKSEEQIKALAEKETEKQKIQFDSEPLKSKIAADLKISLPVKAPEIQLKEVDAEFKKHLESVAEEKFGKKTLAEQIKKAMDEFSGYKYGDNVKLADLNNQPVEGKFKGVEGRFVVIGDRKILLSDLPPAIKWKFDEDICAKKTSEAIKSIREEFKKKKNEFLSSVSDKEKKEFYTKKGYRENAGAWISEEELLNKKIEDARKNNEKENAELKRRIQENTRNKFNKDKIFIENGYRNLNGNWVSESDAVEILTNEEQKKFTEKKNNEISSIRRSADKQAEDEIYPMHGYVRYEGSWIAAKPLFDSLVEKEMKKIKP